MKPNKTEILIGVLLLCLMLTFFSFINSENKWQSKVSLLNSELNNLKKSYNILVQNTNNNKEITAVKKQETITQNKQASKTTLAFFLEENNKHVLYLGDPEGEKIATGLSIDILQAYTKNGLENIKPVWQISPDGKKIAFLSNSTPEYVDRLTDNGVLRISDLDGKNNEILYMQRGSSSHVSLSQFFWSKDNKTVYLLTSVGDEAGSARYLSIVDINTKEVSERIAHDSQFSNPNDSMGIESQDVPLY